MDDIASRSNLEKLKIGTLLRSIQKENDEPENIAAGQISQEAAFLHRQSQYVSEIGRVLKELRLTVLLIKECKTGNAPDGIPRQELLTYYQGNFLTLVHQAKDKVIQLVNLITEDQTPKNPSMEDDIKISELLKKKGKALQEIGIENEIKQWVQENVPSGIAVALRKRTHHHHRISGLRLNRDFLNLDFADIASQKSFQENLTDYGKEKIEKMRIESTERLFSGALTKAEGTLKLIEENIEGIAKALVSYFRLPVSQEEMDEIITNQSKMKDSFKVLNQCSGEKVPEPYKTILNDLVAKTREVLGDKLTAIYLVGSLARGEYEEGYSDMNLYVILSFKDPIEQTFKEDPMFNFRLFTQGEFLSERCQRYRIIAKADGVLLYGTDLVKTEELPNAGLPLGYTLYGDILEILDEAKKWMEENPSASQAQIAIKSRYLAKRIIDFIYAVAMTNKPQFTPNRKERIEAIQDAFPDKMTDILMQISRYGVSELESFGTLIEGFRPKAEMNLEKMANLTVKIKNDIEIQG